MNKEGVLYKGSDMKKYLCTGLLTALLPLSFSVQAQTAFWSFDENNKEATIPVQCDGQFDEARGGVFMPTPEELYEQGELFLLEKGDNKNNAGYCFLSSALQGNVDAQYRVAQLYNKGLVLPQNDLAAYKWAFTAALNGNKEAERLALTLEQFLATEDIELATKSIQTMLPKMTQEKNTALTETDDTLKQKKEQLEQINKEIDDMLGIKFVAPAIQKQTVPEKSDSDKTNTDKSKSATPPTDLTKKPVFTEKDRMK